MACLPIFLSHTTYTSHIPPHMGSNGRQIAVKRGFSCENLPCSRLQKIITRLIFDLEPCPIHQNDHIVHPYNFYNSDLPLEHLKTISDQCNWSQMKAFNVF